MYRIIIIIETYIPLEWLVPAHPIVLEYCEACQHRNDKKHDARQVI